jgi:hypothetical protein
MVVDKQIEASAAAEQVLRGNVEDAYRRARRDVYDVEVDLTQRRSPMQARRIRELEAAEAALRDFRSRRLPLTPAQRGA